MFYRLKLFEFEENMYKQGMYEMYVNQESNECHTMRSETLQISASAQSRDVVRSFLIGISRRLSVTF